MKISIKQLFSYGFLGVSLGFIGLPLYVYFPKYYSESFGISLVSLSFILFISRAIDVILDPFIGWLSDKLIERSVSRKLIIQICSPILFICFMALLFPQNIVLPIYWITAFLIVIYAVYSIFTINYYTLGAEISEDYNIQTALVSYREAFGLMGICIGSILPSILMNYFNRSQTHLFIGLAYFIFIGVGLYYLSTRTPPPIYRKSTTENFLESLKVIIKNKKYICLAVVFLLSNIGASLPATLVLFYIEDVLQGKIYFGVFLSIYFFFSLLGIPIWYKLAEIYSKRAAWMIAMVVTIFGFIWATFLSSFDFVAYGIICMVTGFCVGADIIIPSSILSDIIAQTSNKAKYYGIWGMLGKASITIAGSLGLFTLGMLNYQPGLVVSDLTKFYISICYAFIPCMIKACSLIMLYVLPIDTK